MFDTKRVGETGGAKDLTPAEMAKIEALTAESWAQRLHALEMRRDKKEVSNHRKRIKNRERAPEDYRNVQTIRLHDQICDSKSTNWPVLSSSNHRNDQQ